MSAWRINSRSVLKETSSARCADVRTATTTQMIATATIAPIGMTRLTRAWSHRDPFLSPAISDCAEGNTLAPFDSLARRNNRIQSFRMTCNLAGERRAVVVATGSCSLTPRKFQNASCGANRGSADRIGASGLPLTPACVGRARNADMGGAQRRRPAFAQVGEVRFPRLDPIHQFGIATIPPHHQKIDWHADRKVRPHGRIDGNQAHFQRVVEVHLEIDGAVENGLAVFVLADLQIRRIGRAFDEIAGGIDHEEPHPLAHDLTAEQERDVETHIGAFQRLAFGRVDGANDIADTLRRLKHGRRIHQRFALAGFQIVVAFHQYADHRLADRQVAGRRDRHDALLRIIECVQLAEGRNVVDAGIGSRIGEHHEPLAHENSTAIGHRLRAPPCCRYNDSRPAAAMAWRLLSRPYWPTVMATSSDSAPGPWCLPRTTAAPSESSPIATRTCASVGQKPAAGSKATQPKSATKASAQACPASAAAPSSRPK